jgi:hypothetical protein
MMVFARRNFAFLIYSNCLHFRCILMIDFLLAQPGRY